MWHVFSLLEFHLKPCHTSSFCLCPPSSMYFQYSTTSRFSHCVLTRLWKNFSSNSRRSSDSCLESSFVAAFKFWESKTVSNLEIKCLIAYCVTFATPQHWQIIRFPPCSFKVTLRISLGLLGFLLTDSNCFMVMIPQSVVEGIRCWKHHLTAKSARIVQNSVMYG